MTQPAPTFISLTANPPSGPPGTEVTFTLRYSGTAVTPKELTITGSITDPTTGLSTTGTGTYAVEELDAMEGVVTGPGITLTKVSDDGIGTAVYTATI